MEVWQHMKLTGTNWSCGLTTFFSCSTQVVARRVKVDELFVSQKRLQRFCASKSIRASFLIFLVAMPKGQHPFPSRTR